MTSAAEVNPKRVNPGREAGWFEMLMTGVCAGMYRTAIAPLERIRLLTQVHTELHRHGRALQLPSASELRTANGASGELRRRLIPVSLDFVFNGTTTTYARHIIATEGYSGLLRGNSLAIATSLCSGPTQMYLLSPVHRFIVRYVFLTPTAIDNPMLFILSQFIAAIVSGAIGAALLMPIDVMRKVLAADVKLLPVSHLAVGSASAGAFEYAGPRALAQSVLRGDFANTSGLRAQEYGLNAVAPYACLYRGLMLGIVGQVLYRTLFAGMYQTTAYLRGSEKFGPVQEFLASYLFVGTGTMLLYPLETVRHCWMRAGMSRRAALIDREMLTRGVSTAAGAAMNTNPDAGAELAYRNVTECALHIYRTEGPVGFFRGASLLPVRSLLATCTAFVLPRLFGEYMMQ
jgi:hypothetical protein